MQCVCEMFMTKNIICSSMFFKQKPLQKICSGLVDYNFVDSLLDRGLCRYDLQ